MIDPFVGRLSYVRVASGSLQADSLLYNGTRRIKEKSGHVYQLLGKKHTAVATAAAGDIVAIGKLKDAQTGDTLCDEQLPSSIPGRLCPSRCCPLRSSPSRVPTSIKSAWDCTS